MRYSDQECEVKYEGPSNIDLGKVFEAKVLLISASNEELNKVKEFIEKQLVINNLKKK